MSRIIICIFFIIIFAMIGAYASSFSGYVSKTVGIIVGGFVGLLIKTLFECFALHGRSLKMWWEIHTKYRNELIYLSFSYQCKIEVDGKYLLVRGRRLKNQYQPVGGVYKYYSGARSILDELSFRPDIRMGNEDETDDLRITIKGKHILDFWTWFKKGKYRETSPEREFREELIDSKVLDSDEFSSFPKYNLIRSHDIGIKKSLYFAGYEWIYADVFEFELNEKQKEVIRKAVVDHPDKVVLVTPQEIDELRYNSLDKNLGDNTPWLIE